MRLSEVVSVEPTVFAFRSPQCLPSDEFTFLSLEKVKNRRACVAKFTFLPPLRPVLTETGVFLCIANDFKDGFWKVPAKNRHSVEVLESLFVPGTAI